MDSIYIEKYTLDGITYDLAIYQAEGGMMTGKWVCGACGEQSGPRTGSDSVAGALGRVKGNLYAHHNLHRVGRQPASSG